MADPIKKNRRRPGLKDIPGRYKKFLHSIYGRVVIVITLLAIVLFIAFGIIFRSVNEKYMQTLIYQKGNNIALLVEGALYHAMLENDRNTIQNTLDIIKTMSDIDQVNMYDSENQLVYTTFDDNKEGERNPNCVSCHAQYATMFPKNEKSYRIMDKDTDCNMKQSVVTSRHLMIHSPILNRKSCYESTCHAHLPTEKVLGSLVITIPLSEMDDTLHESSADFFLLVAFITGIMVTFLIIFTRKKIQDPIKAIIRASEAVAAGDTSYRIRIRPNELYDMRMVSAALNQMLDSLQAANKELQNWSQQLEYKVQKKSEELGAAQNELIHIERIASLGKLSLSVAHEINNPLSGILVYTKLVSKQVGNTNVDTGKKESILKHLKLIETETKRCGDIVKSLLDFSRSDQKDFEAAHLHEILRKTAELMNHPMKIRDISFLTDFTAGSDMVSCSPNQIKQACIAILVNASEAVTGNGEVVMRTLNPDNHHIRIEISDNGVGIAQENISHVFEPFFSTKHSTSGIGLGLAIVHGIVQSHKGKIDLKSEPGKGTTFSITLPLIQE